MSPPETVQLGDRTPKQRDALNQLNDLLKTFDLNKVSDLNKSTTDTAKEYLPPLDIKGTNTNTDVSKKTTKIVVKDSKYRKHETKITKDGSNEPIEITTNGVTWTKNGDQWEATDAKGNLIKDRDDNPIVADKILVRGEEGNTELVIAQGPKTTVQRADGSSFTEVRGPNGSRHGEVRNSEGKLTKVIHNGKEFIVGDDGKQLLIKGVPVDKVIKGAHIDKDGVIHRKLGDLEIRLETDGTTVAKNTKSNIETTGYADGTRVYKDTSAKPSKLLGVRDSDRNYIAVKDGKAEVRNAKGEKLRRHLLQDEKVELQDKPPGALKIKDKPAKDKDTVYHLDTTKIVQEKDKHGNVGPVEMTDAKGKTFKFEYKPGSRDADDIRTFKPPDGKVFEIRKNAKEIKVDEERGQVTITMNDDATVTYDLHAQTKTETEGDKSTVQHFDKKYTETYKAGVLQSINQDGLSWKVTIGEEGKPESIQAGGIEYKKPPAKSIEIKDGEITIINEVRGKELSITYHSDRSAEIQGSGGRTVELKLDKDGQPTEISDKCGHTYKVKTDRTGNITGILDAKGNPIKVNGKELTSPPYDLSVTSDGRIEACRDKPPELLVIDPMRQTSVELSKDKKGMPIAKMWDSDGKIVAETGVRLPAGLTENDFDWTSLKVNDLGHAEMKLKTEEGTLTVDLERKITAVETKDKKIVSTEKGRVEIQKKNGKPVSGIIYNENGEKSFSVTFENGKLVKIEQFDKKGKATVVARGDNGVTLELDGPDIVAKQNGLSVVLHPDHSRDFARGTSKHSRDANNWVTHAEGPGRDGKHYSADIEYHTESEKIEIKNGQAMPEKIKFGNGATLTRQLDILDQDGNPKFVLETGTPPAKEFISATVDKKGIVHLADRQGRKYMMTLEGHLMPELPEQRRDRAEVPIPVRAGTETVQYEENGGRKLAALIYNGKETEPRYRVELDDDGNPKKVWDVRKQPPRCIAEIGKRGVISLKLDATKGDIIAKVGHNRAEKTITLHPDSSQDATDAFGRTVSHNSDGLITKKGRAEFEYAPNDVGENTDVYESVGIPGLHPTIARRCGLPIQSEPIRAYTPESVKFENGSRLERNHSDQLDQDKPRDTNFTLYFPGGGSMKCKDAAVDGNGNTHVLVELPNRHPTTGQILGVQLRHYVISPSGKAILLPGHARQFTHKLPNGRTRPGYGAA